MSSADRKVDVNDYLKTSMSFSMKKNPKMTQEELIEDSYNFAIKKFGKDGYAITKMYVKDRRYEEYLKEIQYLIEHKNEFIKRAKDVLKDLN